MIPAWVGAWILTSAVSANNPDVPRVYSRATRQISSSDSTVTIVDDLVRVRGGVVHLEWTGKLDGADYPVEGVEIYLTSAYRQVDDHTLELTQKVDGRPVVRARMVLSPDGQTITTETTDGITTTTTVYRKGGT
ncbi:MAG TPA: hypothetical protein VN628_08470 [Vicinamibacterales bacterium]|nr:hypothetical protein [Vicinamibacterales bacterium]